jgi:hypothetical protein
MRFKQGMLDGRAVELREVSLRVGIDAQAQPTPFDGAMFVLSASAYWADTGERVFKDVADVLDSMTMRLIREINTLSRLAQEVNKPDDLDAPPTTNGTGEAHPSL